MLEINTGTPDFWVYPPGRGWTDLGYNASNSNSSSSDSKKKFKYIDQSGTVSGNVNRDKCWLGYDSGPLLPSQCTFGVVDKANHSSAMDTNNFETILKDGKGDIAGRNMVHVDGMLGLGLAKLANKKDAKSLSLLRSQNSM